ncbi:MAG: response regulator [Sideroxydans sp.]|nr:response regulator [Sideroxydans sp.]
MMHKLQYFLLQLKLRNGEHEQALLRIAFASLIFFYLLVEYQSGKIDHYAVLLFSEIWLAAGLCISISILMNGTASTSRRFFAMLADIGATTYGMMLTQESGALFFGIYLWVIVGNGLRYGIPALISAYVLSVMGFISVIYFNDYWSSNLRLSIGLLIPLVLIPLYLIKLRNQLNQALDSANNANKAKSQFLAHMSHEMRTPLNGLVGISDLLTTTPLNAEQRDLVGTLQNSSKVLRQLIDNVLDISKIESGKLLLEKRAFDLHELVNNAIEMFLPQANEKGLNLSARFTPDTEFTLHGDALHLLQVLINLIGNALKFTAQGKVEVRVSTVQQGPHNILIRFEIIDTGIGIPVESQQAIFERFTQANASIARQYGGTGLGTTISRDLVKLMGGQIGLHSELGIGSLFWFELPFEKQAAQEALVTPTSLNQLRVMSVGITPVEQRAFANHLGGWGVHFEHAESIAQFFSRLTQLQPCKQKGTVILCSPHQLSMRAEVFAQQALVNDVHHTVSLILVNPDFQSHSTEDYLGMGYCCVLRTPINKPLLFNALHSIITPHTESGVISLKDHYERHAQTQRGVRILVADDNGTNRKIISRILDHSGHQVELVCDGDQALDKLEHQRFDLLILDMNMPQMGGLEVLKLYRTMDTRTPATPVIILTADATTEALQACEEADVDAYLTKPVDTITLLDTIARLTDTQKPTDASELTIVNLPDDTSHHSTFLDEHTLQQLALLGEGQSNFMQVVIRGYISETEKILDAMRTALRNREYATLKELAHIIKGSSGNVGAEAMYQLCTTLMQQSSTEMESNASELLKQTQACFKSTRVLLIQHLGETSRASL